MAKGGWMMPGGFYQVGEAGREYIRMGNSGGQVIPEDQMGAGMHAPVVNVYVTTPDAGSFRATERQIGRRAAAAFRHTMRGA